MRMAATGDQSFFCLGRDIALAVHVVLLHLKKSAVTGETVSELELAAPDVEVDTLVREWLENYVDRSHPKLGRSGPVCPFIAPSLRSDLTVIKACHWQGDLTPERMTRLIAALVEEFLGQQWKSSNANLHAMVVAITGLPEESWWLVDEGHRQAKDAIVARGLMLGEFHPLCESPAVWNPLFPVNRSPLPMYAIRNMALHDVLFLHDNPSWFRHYQKQYGSRYAGSASMNPYFSELFESGNRLLETSTQAV